MEGSQIASLSIVETPGGQAVYVDGQPLSNVRSLTLEMKAGQTPLATIVVIPELINVDGIAAEIEKESMDLMDEMDAAKGD